MNRYEERDTRNKYFIGDIMKERKKEKAPLLSPKAKGVLSGGILFFLMTEIYGMTLMTSNLFYGKAGNTMNFFKILGNMLKNKILILLIFLLIAFAVGRFIYYKAMESKRERFEQNERGDIIDTQAPQARSKIMDEEELKKTFNLEPLNKPKEMIYDKRIWS